MLRISIDIMGRNYRIRNSVMVAGLEWEDYGARMYDQQIGRWMVLDGKADIYQNTTPFAYAANQPTNAIDPDGNLIIFINGMHGGDGGKPDYWRAPPSFSNEGISIRAFDYLVMKHFNDFHRTTYDHQYLDGSIGGMGITLLGLEYPEISDGNMTAESRYDAGKEKGEEDAAFIINSLHRTGNVIDESLKIVSHSMGGAYAKGYIRAIVQYAMDHPELTNGLKISEFDFDPFEGGAQTPEPRVHTEQKMHNGHKHGSKADRIADEKENGLNGTEWNALHGDNNTFWESPTNGLHTIFSFFENIDQLQEGTYHLINGVWQKE
jgi:RHS repeat-associated protein